MSNIRAKSRLGEQKESEDYQIDIKRINEVAGAAVYNINLRKPLSKTVYDRLVEALLTYHILVFKHQDLSKDQQVEFTKNFGELEEHVGRLPDGSRFPTVHTVTNIDSVTGKPTTAPHTDGNYHWHTDKSYHAKPSLVTLLHALEVPPKGGDTLFCNMHKAYESLSRDERSFFSRLKAVHSWEASRKNTGNIPASEEQKKERPPVAHPIVRTHPDTGKKALYLGMHIGHIEGFPKKEGKKMLDELLSKSTVPKNIYRHSWEKGDLVLWDNRCLLHRADRNFDMGVHRRVLHRTVVKGTVPY